MAQPQPTPQLKAAYALHQARKHRHHPDCRCGRYDGHCSAADAMWTQKMNIALEALLDA